MKIIISFFFRLLAVFFAAGFLFISISYWFINFPTGLISFLGLFYFQLILLLGVCLLSQFFWFYARRIIDICRPGLVTVDIFVKIFRLLGEVSLLGGLVLAFAWGIPGLVSYIFPKILAAIPYTPFHLAQSPGIYLMGVLGGSFMFFLFFYGLAEILLIYIRPVKTSTEREN